jgi:hypothetical protein
VRIGLLLAMSCAGDPDGPTGLLSIGDSIPGDLIDTGSYGVDGSQGYAGLVVEVHDPERAYDGTTLFSAYHDGQPARIIEVDMYGEIVWEYEVPSEHISHEGMLCDVDLLDEDTILVAFPRSGVFEIDRHDQSFGWSYLTENISHDADRLDNGNTIFVNGQDDTANDVQVVEISSHPEPGPGNHGVIQWQWAASDLYLDRFPELGVGSGTGVADGGWTHANAVQRLDNGDTLVSLRNFNITAIIDPLGNLVREYDWSAYGEDTDPHEPVMLDNGNLLVCLQQDAMFQAVEIDAETEEEVWSYAHPTAFRTARDCDRLPNGNTLIVGVKGDEPASMDTDFVGESSMIEVTPEGDVVWQLTLRGYSAARSPGHFYKALRIGEEYVND